MSTGLRNERAALRALLVEIRTEAGLRQADISAALDKPQSFVSKYESGERRLDVIEVVSICNVCKISAADFMTRLEKKIKQQR